MSMFSMLSIVFIRHFPRHFFRQKIRIDIQQTCVIIVIEYEIAVHKSVLSADFKNEISAFFIFYNTPLSINNI